MNNKKIFYNCFLLFFVTASFLGGFLFTNNQAEGYVYSNACRTSCNDSTFLPPCAAGCFFTDDYVDIGATIDKGACAVRQVSTSGNPIECSPLTIYNASCNDGVTACSEDRCSDTGSENGAKCTVTVGNSADFSGSASCNIEAVTTKIGNWDDSQNKCVICSGLKESEICADTSSIRINDISRLCDSGDSAGASFETACSSAVSALCDDKIEGAACGGGKICDSLGQCVLPEAMNLTVSASDNPLMTSDTTTVTFRTKKSDSTNINGATIDVTSVSCGTLPDPTNTTSSGSTTSTFSSGASAEICTINVKATHGDYDDVTGTYIITVQGSDCFNDYRLWFDEDDYVAGDTLSLFGKVFAGGNDSMLCLYEGNTERDSLILVGGAFPAEIDFANVNVGTWKGGLFKDETGSCGSYASADCQTETIVIAGGPPPPPTCISNIICSPTGACSGTPGSMTVDVECVETGTCINPTTTTANPCCGTSADCAAGDACDTSTVYGTCIPCKGEGIPAASASLCCDGLNLVDDGSGTMICSSKCDPTASFFCNPLRESVETLIQGGEKMIGYILGIIGSVALLLMIISGIMYMTSAGNEEKIASSKKILTGAIIGLAISLLSFSLLQLLISIL